MHADSRITRWMEVFGSIRCCARIVDISIGEGRHGDKIHKHRPVRGNRPKGCSSSASGKPPRQRLNGFRDRGDRAAPPSEPRLPSLTGGALRRTRCTRKIRLSREPEPEGRNETRPSAGLLRTGGKRHRWLPRGSAVFRDKDQGEVNRCSRFMALRIRRRRRSLGFS